MTTAESAFVRIPALAARYGAVNLAQGVFDHGPDPALTQALADVGPDVEHQYAPSPGLPRLQEAVAAHIIHHEDVTLTPDTEITITVGATEALHCTVSALVGPGDEVILIEPAYEQYAPAVQSAGGRCRGLMLDGPDTRITVQALEELTTETTVAIIINSPWNPLGRCLTSDEWQAVAAFSLRHGVVVVSDETYEHLLLDGTAHRGVLSAVSDPELRVKISSVSKTFAATGWRVGWAVTGSELTRRVRAVHQYLTFCPPTPLQLASAVVLESPRTLGLLQERTLELAERVDGFARALTELGMPATAPRAGFYVLADVAEPAGTWCERMITQAGVAALPMQVFHSRPTPTAESSVRFAVCKRPGTLATALQRLQRHLDSGEPHARRSERS